MVGRRSDFFLQPLEPRRLLSGASAADAAPHGQGSAGAQHVAAHVVEEQVEQLRSALSEMADRMAQFEKLLDGG